jgi:cell division protein FtsZ
MAISNPLLDDVTMKGAKGVLINITGGPDLMLFEVEQAANRIRAEVDPDANIIFGNTILPEMEGRIRVSVVATGIDAIEMKLPDPKVTSHPRFTPPSRPVPQLKPNAAAPAPAPVPNPVHAHQKAVAESMMAQPSEAEAYILGGSDAPEMPLDPAAEFAAATAKYPAVETVRSTAEMPLATPAPAQPEKKAGWSLFGRKKAPTPDMRAEPQMAPRPVARPQARPQGQPQVEQPVQPPQQQSGEDLFPEQGRDEQFEIPAFLRRQSN